MTFASRLTRCPIPFEPERGADAALPFADLAPELRALIAGTGGCSPYLSGLLTREAAWIAPALCGTPEAALEAEFARLGDVALDQLGPELRRAKRRVALLAGLADLGGVWPLETVTGALTRLGDLAVDLALKRLVADEIRRGKLPGATPGDAAIAGGMVALAMGKMGAGELNYSSDIDLICLFDESRFDPADQMEARASFIRVTRKMAALLSDITAEGYVFRTDLRLRPDASVTPVCISMAAAEQYYEAEGRTWERAAYIKARPCAGDLAAGQRFLTALTPFVWRKHLDFAAIQDAHDMRLRIREHKGLHGPITLPGHDMKLGQGGIREIEFFTQTRQLIAGGRDPDLRDRTTVGGLSLLASKGWVDGEVAAELIAHYREHREIEHRVQMVNDAQTHRLPTAPDGLARIAAMMGEGDVQAWSARLLGRLERVEALTGAFFAPGEAAEAPDLSEGAQRIVDGWRSYPCLRSDRARGIFRRVEPEVLRLLQRAANPRRGPAPVRRFPQPSACRGAAVLAVRGEPAACRTDRRHLCHRAGAWRIICRATRVFWTRFWAAPSLPPGRAPKGWPPAWRRRCRPRRITRRNWMPRAAGRRNGASAWGCTICAGWPMRPRWRGTMPMWPGLRWPGSGPRWWPSLRRNTGRPRGVARSCWGWGRLGLNG